MGSDFYIAYYSKATSRLSLAVTTSELNGANFTIECFHSACVNAGFPLSYSIQNEEAVYIDIPLELLVSSGSQRNSSIHLVVQDEKKVTVFGNHNGTTNAASLSLISCDSIRNTLFDEYEYLTLHNTRFSAMTGTMRDNFLLMVPCEDMTTITVHPSQNISIPFSDLYIYGGVSEAGPSSPASFIANSGNTLLLLTVEDLSGSIVTSNKPLIVYAGQECGRVPNSFGTCDTLIEQMLPSFTYGTRFLLTPLAFRQTGDIFRVATCLNGTEVNFTCITPGQGIQNMTHQNAVINRGQWTQFTTSGNLTNEPDWRADYCTLESNYPVLVMQYSQGRNVDAGLTSHLGFGDPEMIMIPPTTQYSNNYTIINSIARHPAFSFGYLNIAVHSNFALNVSLRSNNTITSIDSGWNPFYCHNGIICGWGTQVAIYEYQLYLYHNDPDPEAAVCVIVYGFASAISLGSRAGMTLSPIGGE